METIIVVMVGANLVLTLLVIMMLVGENEESFGRYMHLACRVQDIRQMLVDRRMKRRGIREGDHTPRGGERGEEIIKVEMPESNESNRENKK